MNWDDKKYDKDLPGDEWKRKDKDEDSQWELGPVLPKESRLGEPLKIKPKGIIWHILRKHKVSEAGVIADEILKEFERQNYSIIW